jgi:hypothetical protein
MLLDILHAIGVIVLCLLPVILPQSAVERYGLYISLYMTAVILQWNVLDGACFLNRYEKPKTHNNVVALIQKGLSIKDEDARVLDLVTDFLFCFVAYYLANGYPHLQACIIMLTVIYFVAYKFKPRPIHS